MAFPPEHWTKLRSTNPLERVNREIGRRCDVVGILPNDPPRSAWPGALLIEQNDEWIVCRRYLSEESMRAILCAGTDREGSPSQISEEADELPPQPEQLTPPRRANYTTSHDLTGHRRNGVSSSFCFRVGAAVLNRDLTAPLLVQSDERRLPLCAVRRSVGAASGHDPMTALTGQFRDQVAVVVQDGEIVFLGSCCDGQVAGLPPALAALCEQAAAPEVRDARAAVVSTAANASSAEPLEREHQSEGLIDGIDLGGVESARRMTQALGVDHRRLFDEHPGSRAEDVDRRSKRGRSRARRCWRDEHGAEPQVVVRLDDDRVSRALLLPASRVGRCW